MGSLLRVFFLAWAFGSHTHWTNLNTYRGVLNDGFPAVDDVLLQLVRQHALDGLAIVALCDLLDSVSNCVGLEKRRNSSLAYSVIANVMNKALIGFE